MGCEAHPNVGNRVFVCPDASSPALDTVFSPYFVNGKEERPHENDAPAFEPLDRPRTETHSLPTTHARLTDRLGWMEQIEVVELKAESAGV